MTGRSGPISGASNAGRPRKAQARQPGRRTPRKALAVVGDLDSRSGEAPASLGEVGTAAWTALAHSVPGFHAQLDAGALERLCRLLDEREVYREALEAHGALLAEPIVTPRGDIVGKRLVPNPAEGMLRRADRALDTLGDRLALSPASRARLGLAVSQAQAVAERLIADLRAES